MNQKNKIELDADTIELLSKLNVFFMSPEKTLNYLITTNEYFGNVKPIEIIQAGRAKKLLGAINSLFSENR
jgi:hypothetical protein